MDAQVGEGRGNAGVPCAHAQGLGGPLGWPVWVGDLGPAWAVLQLRVAEVGGDTRASADHGTVLCARVRVTGRVLLLGCSGEAQVGGRQVICTGVGKDPENPASPSSKAGGAENDWVDEVPSCRFWFSEERGSVIIPILLSRCLSRKHEMGGEILGS